MVSPPASDAKTVGQPLPADLEHAYDEGGHLMDVHEPSRVRQSADLAAFVRSASAPG